MRDDNMLKAIVFCIVTTIIVIAIVVHSYSDMVSECREKGGILVKSSEGSTCIDRNVIIE